MSAKNILAALAGGLVWSAGTLSGHHAFSAEFDADKPVQLKGTVTSVEWVNPHIWIYIAVAGPNGRIESWAIEGGAPNALMRRGFRKSSLGVGTSILIEGYRAKDGSLKANGRDLTTSDGQKLFMGSSGTGAPYDSK